MPQQIVWTDVPQQVLDEINRIDWSDPKMTTPKITETIEKLQWAIKFLKLPTRTA